MAAGATVAMHGGSAAAADGKKTFTILHTNDLHSNLIGMAPARDYTPLTLNDDRTRGGFERLATMIATRKMAHQDQGPVLILDAGDYSMGTAFAVATRETGCELQLLSMIGCDATTFGNHDFDLGPDGTAASIAVAAKASRVPAVVASNTDFTAADPTLRGLQRLADDGVIRRYIVIERGRMRFGIFGLLGKEAQLYTDGAGAVKFSDSINPATREPVRQPVKIVGEGIECAHRFGIAIRTNRRNVDPGANVDSRRRGMNPGQVRRRAGSFFLRHHLHLSE